MPMRIGVAQGSMPRPGPQGKRICASSHSPITATRGRGREIPEFSKIISGGGEDDQIGDDKLIFPRFELATLEFDGGALGGGGRRLVGGGGIYAVGDEFQRFWIGTEDLAGSGLVLANGDIEKKMVILAPPGKLAREGEGL